MKKAMFVFLAATVLVACNNASTTETTVDSTKVDSAKVSCDSTVKVDTVKAK